ncbi:MAG: trypsin-like peptidase domain-containing protein [Pseudobutyrivibrio sp.]|nr:trypsin-like peptidase domain-containing protein [Pseudobutyrivibrio sp.]
MSDFLDNGPEKRDSEYSYKREDINQGEGTYSWTPYDYESKDKIKDKSKKDGFGKKLVKVAALALVFGLVSGASFQAASYGMRQLLPAEPTSEQTVEPVIALPQTTDSDQKVNVTTVSQTSDIALIADNVMPAIVQVTNVGIQEYRTLFGIYTQDVSSAGSGIIISQDDEYIYIASNNHVVSGAQTLTITFCDEEAVTGEIKGTDNSCDLAVIAVKISDIKTETMAKIKVASMGASDLLMVGQGCVVIGNALGYGQSVTSGVISAKDRVVELEGDDGEMVVNSLLQTDAAVNPGNSGGALLNMDGEVIGIVSAKYTNEAVEGMGYAIPIDYALGIIQQMINSEVVNDINASYFGIGGVDITSELAAQYDLPRGVYVQQVMEGSGAAAAGIEQGDVITSFNGRTVTSMSTIQNVLQYLPAGTTIDVVVAKASDEYAETTYQVTLTHKNQKVQ